jgi:hypothetical protein
VQNDAPELPEFIVNELPNLPRHADRKTLADIITRLLFPVSHRSLEIWPLRWRFVNGHALAETYEALAHAWRKFNAAPAMMNGRGRSRATRRNKPSHGDVDRETAA